jgi:hypothetical protein
MAQFLPIDLEVWLIIILLDMSGLIEDYIMCNHREKWKRNDKVKILYSMDKTSKLKEGLPHTQHELWPKI